MTGTVRKQGMRSAVSIKDRDTSAALLDLQGAVNASVPITVIRRTIVYTTPIYISFDRNPAMVLHRSSAQKPPAVLPSGVSYTWSGGQIQITFMLGLTVGKTYDTNFVIFG
jgi:hypothetical protein